MKKLVLILAYASLVFPNFAQTKSLSRAAHRVFCEFKRPPADFARLRIGDIHGTAMLMPQQEPRNITNTGLFSDDNISNLIGIVYGSRTELNILNTVSVEASNPEIYAHIGFASVDSVEIASIYNWRAYSERDLLRRAELCKKETNLELSISLNQASVSVIKDRTM